MESPLEVLDRERVSHYLYSYSALDRFFRVREPGSVYVLAESSLPDLARFFDELDYSETPTADAALTVNGVRYVLKCVDDGEGRPRESFSVLELLYDRQRDVFLDPRDVYPDLRKPELRPRPGAAPEKVVALMDAARIVSRYHYEANGELFPRPLQYPPLSAAVQRDLLVGILSSGRPEKALELLAGYGFVEAYWPELAALSGVPHTKDYHPEGDVWEHTLQTFRHRKSVAVPLALALLFHDAGKAVAPSSGERRFDAHAEHSVRITRRFLRRLRFSEETLEHVSFLVRYHMLPPAIRRLPEYRTAPVMASPYYPDLLELYYADLSSSFRSPEGYYEACRLYRRHLRKSAGSFPKVPHSAPRRRSHFR